MTYLFTSRGTTTSIIWNVKKYVTLCPLTRLARHLVVEIDLTVIIPNLRAIKKVAANEKREMPERCMVIIQDHLIYSNHTYAVD